MYAEISARIGPVAKKVLPIPDPTTSPMPRKTRATRLLSEWTAWRRPCLCIRWRCRLPMEISAASRPHEPVKELTVESSFVLFLFKPVSQGLTSDTRALVIKVTCTLQLTRRCQGWSSGTLSEVLYRPMPPYYQK